MRRFELGEPYKMTQIGPRGTVVVMPARPYGKAAFFTSRTPCCGREARINAAIWSGGSGFGAPVTCRGCGWQYYAHLANPDGFVPYTGYEAAHPQISCDRVEWESAGHGTGRS